jgi:uncharacterized protein YgbK (DUF1537 family)
VKAAIGKLPAGLYYKKIDSLCRGNPAAELDEEMTHTGAQAAFATPAFPAAKRTLVNGKLDLSGAEIDVLSVFSAIPGRKAALLSLADLRGKLQRIASGTC